MRVLHLHSSFQPGGKELRAARLMAAFGPDIEHTVVSAVPGALGAAQAIPASVKVAYPEDFPSLTGKPLPNRLLRLARAMYHFDLILTYNWGAMDAVMAHTLFADRLDLPALVHHEDGFNEDEAVRLKASRNWYRRIALGRSAALIVPSERLEQIALGPWQQPEWRVKRIGNGIDTAAYGRPVRHDALPRVIKREGERWLGTMAGLRPVKNLPRLVRAFAAMPEEWQLVILGEGPDREAIRSEAARLEISHRVHLPGFVPDPAHVTSLFDLFALSSDSEQFPLSVVEAMATGLTVVSTDVGDVADMVTPDNRPFIVDRANEAALADALVTLAANPGLCKAIGTANRTRARTLFDERAMISSYRQTYAEALGQAKFA